jgi:hypothetical protein
MTPLRLFSLALADMRGNVDNATLLALFDSADSAETYERSFRVEPYDDEPSEDFFGNVHGFRKVYAKGSPLEWFNPPSGYADGIMEHVYSTTPQEFAEHNNVPFNPVPKQP